MLQEPWIAAVEAGWNGPAGSVRSCVVDSLGQVSLYFEVEYVEHIIQKD